MDVTRLGVTPPAAPGAPVPRKGPDAPVSDPTPPQSQGPGTRPTPPAPAAPSPGGNGPQFGFTPALDLPPPASSAAVDAVDALMRRASAARDAGTGRANGRSIPSGITVQGRLETPGSPATPFNLSVKPPPPGTTVEAKVPTPPGAPAITLDARNSGHATESLTVTAGNTQLTIQGGGAAPVTVGGAGERTIIRSKSNITNNRTVETTTLQGAGTKVTYKEVTQNGQTTTTGKIAIDEPGLHLNGRFSVGANGAIELTAQYKESGKSGTNPLYEQGRLAVNLPPPPPPPIQPTP